MKTVRFGRNNKIEWTGKKIECDCGCVFVLELSDEDEEESRIKEVVIHSGKAILVICPNNSCCKKMLVEQSGKNLVLSTSVTYVNPNNL